MGLLAGILVADSLIGGKIKGEVDGGGLFGIILGIIGIYYMYKTRTWIIENLSGYWYILLILFIILTMLALWLNYRHETYRGNFITRSFGRLCYTTAIVCGICFMTVLIHSQFEQGIFVDLYESIAAWANTTDRNIFIFILWIILIPAYFLALILDWGILLLTAPIIQIILRFWTTWFPDNMKNKIKSTEDKISEYTKIIERTSSESNNINYVIKFAKEIEKLEKLKQIKLKHDHVINTYESLKWDKKKIK